MKRRELLDLLFPPGLYCMCCDKIIDKSRPYNLCNECLAEFKWATGRCCIKCGKSLSERNPRDLCFSCAENTHVYNRGYSCSEYGMLEKSVIYKLKYGSETYIADVLGDIIYDRLVSLVRIGEIEELSRAFDVIIPVPSHRGRKLERGYNQAELIAERVSELSGISMRKDIVERTSHTKALRSLTPDARRAQLAGVFAVRSGREQLLEGRKILLVDDIYTTGATIDAVSTVLYAAGAACVDFVSFASGADVVK
ncbi:MAG: ComF family protein [Mogibacterium sp.]|nr:ComF family protein [Mogibacterium sp.]